MKLTSRIILPVLIMAAVSCTERKPVANHVIFIGFDGFSSSYFDESELPNVKALKDAGCYTMKKRSTLNTSSAVNWASMFMGAGPEFHGYTKWGSKTPELPSREIIKNGIFPTIFQVLRDARPDAEIGVLYDWDGIKYLVDTLSLSHLDHSEDFDANPCELGDLAAEYIRTSKPNLLAVCFDNPDHIGHGSGWDSPEYHENLRMLDGCVKSIVDAVREAGIIDETVFIFTSDHGGIENRHGGMSIEELETPFIVCGKGIANNGEMPEYMIQYDVAPTIAKILGIDDFVPQVWIGRPMMSIFE